MAERKLNYAAMPNLINYFASRHEELRRLVAAKEWLRSDMPVDDWSKDPAKVVAPPSKEYC